MCLNRVCSYVLNESTHCFALQCFAQVCVWRLLRLGFFLSMAASLALRSSVDSTISVTDLSKKIHQAALS
jgi:hypothetical protein